MAEVSFNPIKEPTNALETLGTIITGAEGRDAIHLAVVPLVASEKVYPGQHLNKGGGTVGETVGIVDPFLAGPVMPGQHFWLVIYPRKITALRHVWEHPSFPEAAAVTDAKAASETWLRHFAETHDCPPYDVLMAAATGNHEANARADDDPDGYPDYYSSRNDGEYLYFGGHDAHGEIPPEFWDHVSVVTGRPVPKSERAEYFSCSC